MKKFMMMFVAGVCSIVFMNGCAMVATVPPAEGKPVVNKTPRKCEKPQQMNVKKNNNPKKKFRDNKNEPAQLIIYHVIITPDMIKEMQKNDMPKVKGNHYPRKHDEKNFNYRPKKHDENKDKNFDPPMKPSEKPIEKPIEK